jgi:hypothetical protein
MVASPTSTDGRHARACRREARSPRRPPAARDDRRLSPREARAPDFACVREPHALYRRQVMNECTARCLRADEPPARQGRSPASVDHGWRCTTRRAAGVDDLIEHAHESDELGRVEAGPDADGAPPDDVYGERYGGSCVGRATGSSATKAIAVFDGNSGFGRFSRASRRLQYESAEDEMPLRDANSL